MSTPDKSLFLPPDEARSTGAEDESCADGRLAHPTDAACAADGDVSEPAPEAPGTLEATGLSSDGILALCLKLLSRGELSGTSLSNEVKIALPVLDPIIEAARAEQLIEVRNSVGVGTAGYLYSLTSRGRDRARQYLEINGYIGPAPVPLEQYIQYVNTIATQRRTVNRQAVASGFADLIVTDDMLDQLGPAVNARRAMFLYGPPGNGKSAMSAGIGRALGGEIYIPYALDLGGEIAIVFDPVIHKEKPLEVTTSLVKSETTNDPRWVRIRRPVITVGGELTMDELQHNFNALAKFYESPVQLKANCGVLLVDDFGRQQMPASDLLNRWIVPLESRVDYLALNTGRKFEVPFEVFVIFATNLEPRSLADEAFLRRIPYKVYAPNPSLDQFSAIFYMVCQQYGITFDQSVIEYLCQEYYEGRGLEMRACHPRDLVQHMVNLCDYRGQSPTVNQRLLDEACRTYFLDKPLYGTEAVA